MIKKITYKTGFKTSIDVEMIQPGIGFRVFSLEYRLGADGTIFFEPMAVIQCPCYEELAEKIQADGKVIGTEITTEKNYDKTVG